MSSAAFCDVYGLGGTERDDPDGKAVQDELNSYKNSLRPMTLLTFILILVTILILTLISISNPDQSPLSDLQNWISETKKG